MDKYVFNSTKAPQIYAGRTLPPENYSTLTNEESVKFKQGGVDVHIEGNEGFVDLWERNIPEKTPNQIVD